jgi:hypothetical protein
MPLFMEDWIIYLVMLIALGAFLVQLVDYYRHKENWWKEYPDEWHPGDPEPW